ncbi:hypothetical protein ACLESD_06890 [Pyxidicoccus sp. 3LFB2]
MSWHRPESLGWYDCDPGSTLVERHTPGEGGPPFELRRTRIGAPGMRAQVQAEGVAPRSGETPSCCTVYFPPGYFSFAERKPSERFIRRDVFQVGQTQVEVEVVSHTTRLDSECDYSPCPCAHDVLEEEVWYRSPRLTGEGPVRVRFDPARSFHSGFQGCSGPPHGSAPDTEGLSDTRVATAVDVPVTIDGAVHRCMRVRTWPAEDTLVEALECPSVLGGRAMWRTTQTQSTGSQTTQTVEVVSFDCRRSAPREP